MGEERDERALKVRNIGENGENFYIF